MSSVVTATVGSSSINLTNKAPYRLLRATHMGGAPLHRVTNQGPEQNGDTDEGYRLEPRTVELVIGYFGTTDAITDGYRDTLVSFFKPLTSTPILLRVTRDDGGVRQLSGYRYGKIDIKLFPNTRPGHYQEATIRLRAANPAYYDPTPGTVTVTGSGGTAADWYLAGGAIGTARVLMSGGTPAQGATWSYAGSIAYTTSWTIAVRADKETATSTSKYMFYVDNNDAIGERDIVFRAGTVVGDAVPNYYADVDGGSPLGTAFMTAGTSNYFIRHNDTGLDVGSDPYPPYKDLYNNGTANPAVVLLAAADSPRRPIGGATRRWRSDSANSVGSRWAGTVHLYALYSPGLSYAEIQALDAYMAGGIGGTAYQQTSVPYQGDLPEYPTISITGPITNPQVYNVSTNERLDFVATIGAGTTYVIDTTPGVKSVLQGTTNKRGELADYSDLDTWHITPDVNDGYNSIIVYGTGTGTATTMRIVYYNRYSSF